MLSEFVDEVAASSHVGRNSEGTSAGAGTTIGLVSPPKSTVSKVGSFNGAVPPDAAAPLAPAAPAAPTSLDVLSEIIHRELEVRRRAVAAKAATARAESERARRDNAPASIHRAGPSILNTSMAASASASTGMGIADMSSAQDLAKSADRQQKLEKMVKALVARVERVILMK